MTHLRSVPDPTPRQHDPAGGHGTPSIAELERWATVLRMDCVSMLAVAKSGHLDSSLSSADIVAALYYRVLRHDPANPGWPERDRFVLCKGHAAPIQYAALAHQGYFPREELMGLRQIGRQLQGHPDMLRTRGVEVSTGSLGQGLSMCLGIALALRLDGLDDTAHVFGILSDGDCQEGQTWEAATAAPHFGLTNVTAIVDYNHLQTDGTTEEIMDTGDVRAKFEAFGWDAVEIDGHDMAAIVERARAQPDARPPGGDRLPDEEGQGRVGDGGQVRLPRQAAEPRARLGGARGARGATRAADQGARRRRRGCELMAAVAEAKSDAIATRQAYGDALRALGHEHEDVVALDADLACSTMSAKFADDFPERFFNCGAAEANMMSMACGLAATGKVPYASTFAIFASGRAYDQVRLGIAHNELKVRIGASHGGVSLGEDGASHQMIEDVALMRAMPRMQVVVPADYNQAYRAVIDSYEANDQPMYLRFGRPATPIVYDEIPDSLGEGVDVLRQGKDISLVATGHMVWRALEAAESLEREDGVEAEVVNVSIIKPLSSAPVLESLSKTGVAVTAEEHRVAGGLADAVRTVAAEQHPVPIFAVGMGDEFGLSGTGEACMEHFGLTARGIADRAREALVLKPIVSRPPLFGPEWT